MTTAPTFQRARRPEQVQARREAILDAALALIAESPLSEVTLTALADRAGLAKSNVLRYFDSREGVLLEVLGDRWGTWLDALEPRFAELPPSGHDYRRERAFAALLAESIAADRVLCELVCSMSSVLERNVTVDTARAFKIRAHAYSARFEAMIAAAFPALASDAVEHLGASVLILTTGLWTFANPTSVLAQVQAELGMPDPAAAFRENLERGLAAQLVGVAALGR